MASIKALVFFGFLTVCSSAASFWSLSSWLRPDRSHVTSAAKLVIINEAYGASPDEHHQSQYYHIDGYADGGRTSSPQIKIEEDWESHVMVTGKISGFSAVFREERRIMNDEDDWRWDTTGQCLIVVIKVTLYTYEEDMLHVFEAACPDTPTGSAEKFYMACDETWKHGGARVSGRFALQTVVNSDYDDVYKRQAKITVKPQELNEAEKGERLLKEQAKRETKEKEEQAIEKLRELEERSRKAEKQALEKLRELDEKSIKAREEEQAKRETKEKARRLKQEAWQRRFHYSHDGGTEAGNWADMRARGYWNDNHFNVAVIGFNNVGKSTFLNRIINLGEEVFETGEETVTSFEMLFQGKSHKLMFKDIPEVVFWDFPGKEGGMTVDQYAHAGGLRFFDLVVIAAENALQEFEVGMIAHITRSSGRRKVEMMFVKTKMNNKLVSRWRTGYKQMHTDCNSYCPSIDEAMKDSREEFIKNFDKCMNNLRSSSSEVQMELALESEYTASQMFPKQAFSFSGFSKWFDETKVDLKKGCSISNDCKRKVGDFFDDQYEEFCKYVLTLSQLRGKLDSRVDILGQCKNLRNDLEEDANIENGPRQVAQPMVAAIVTIVALIVVAIVYLRGKTSHKCFEDTNFFQVYRPRNNKYDLESGMVMIDHFIDAVGKAIGVSSTDVSRYQSDLRIKLFEDIRAADIQTVTSVAWTTSLKLDEKELCSHINLAIAKDESDLLDRVVPICEIVNMSIVTRTMEDFIASSQNDGIKLGMEYRNSGDAGSIGSDQGPGYYRIPIPWPANNETYRGVGMPHEHLSFFREGKVYRATIFLASSKKRTVAEEFMAANAVGGKCAVMFTIEFHPTLKCQHASYFDEISSCKGEEEFVMPPYSGFKVLSASFTPDHVFEVRIRASHDNQDPELHRVPLAPWH